MTEKLVKWQIPGSHDMVSAKKILGQLLATLLVNHPNEVTLIDRKQREWNYDETQNENDFLQEFETASIQLHALRKKDKSIAKWISITRFSSISNPQDWKNNDPFYALIAETKTYIFPHPFGIAIAISYLFYSGWLSSIRRWKQGGLAKTTFNHGEALSGRKKSARGGSMGKNSINKKRGRRGGE